MRDVIGAVALLAYYLGFAVVVPALMRLIRVPEELIRKTQHVVYALSVFLMLRLFSQWYWAIAAGALLLLIAYPVLWWSERSAWLARIVVARPGDHGELRRQLVSVQATFGLLILVFWGILGYRWHHIAVTAVMAWGFGDAAAALIGKAVGRRKIVHRLIEETKTYVGAVSMAAVAGVAIFLTLTLYGHLTWYVSLAVAAIVAPVCAVVELFSRRGADTITVPLAAAALIAPLVYAFSLLK
jgi:dolichol kinase